MVLGEWCARASPYKLPRANYKIFRNCVSWLSLQIKLYNLQLNIIWKNAQNSLHCNSFYYALLLSMLLKSFVSIATVLKMLYNGVYYRTSLPTPCSLRSCWQLEISHRRSINTVEIGKPKSGLDVLFC